MKNYLFVILALMISSLSFSQNNPQKAYFKGKGSFQDYVKENLEYPEKALEHEIEGEVKVRFVVEKDGRVSAVRITNKKRLGFGCEEAAIQVVKSSSGMWQPATQRGKAVRMVFELPVRFDLDPKYAKKQRKAKRKARKKNKREAKKMRKASKRIID